MTGITAKLDFNLKINKISIINNIYKYAKLSFNTFINEFLKYKTFDKYAYYDDEYYSILVLISDRIRRLRKINSIKIEDKYIKKELRMVIKDIQKALKIDSDYPQAKRKTDYNLKNLLFECKNYIN